MGHVLATLACCTCTLDSSYSCTCFLSSDAPEYRPHTLELRSSRENCDTRVVYTGKLWGTQAWFQGFEGYMDLATIESHIFGAYMGRLKWSPAGSPLCRHETNEFGECVGLDPTTRSDVRDMVERAKLGGFGELKIFTLVDTYMLTVTMFAAVRPPVAVLLCGHEGGMQRAVMCSYDWASQTLYRETVLRMETPVLEKMFRVNRFRFGLQRPLSEVQ